MVDQAARLTVAIALALFGAGAFAETFDVRGSCRDGYAHGVYELRGSAAALRAQGAFNRGLRTSSFIYWTSGGVRVAHIPYDEGIVSGTVALWYAQSRGTRPPQQRLEAAYAKGQRHGITRSWYPNARPRGEFMYEQGTLVAAKAWDALGKALPESDAREQARRDAIEDQRTFASLDAIVDANLPACDDSRANPSGTRS
ncbi:MAG: hypothetical protein ABI585_13205 [Betaproteobacteria bacterium]